MVATELAPPALLCFLVVRAFPLFTFCFSGDGVLYLVRSHHGPILLFIGCETLWQKIVSISFVFLISIKNGGFALDLATLQIVTRCVIQQGAFAAISCFPVSTFSNQVRSS